MDPTELVETFYEPIYRFCAQMLRSPAEAEDATQDVFERAIESLESVREPERIRYWIYSTARNRCTDKLRWLKRMMPRMGEVDEDVAIAPRRLPELQMTILRLVQKLPLKQREVFVLRHWHGFSTEEAAKMLAVDPGTVKSHLKRAVDRLKNELSDGENLESAV